MKHIFLLILSASLIFHSCTKKNDGSNPESCKVKSIRNTSTWFNGGSDEIWYYTYDDKGRVARIDHGAEQSSDYETITYQTDKIIVYDSYYRETSPASQKTTTYNLDANGRIINDGIHTYKYNSEGYVIEERSTVNDKIFNVFSYQNGNLAKMENYDNSTTAESTTLIDYSNETAQELSGYGSYLGYYLSPYYEALTGYFGKSSKNQYVRETTSYIGSPTTDIYNYNYEKDSKGKITSVKSNGNTNYSEEFKISYHCQ